MDPLHMVGAGGIGCAVGYALRAAGIAVVFVDANPEKVAWGNTHGVQVEGKPPQSAHFILFDDWQPSPHATVLLCTKCYDNAIVLDRLAESTTIIPVQNGFDSALEARHHAFEGIASFVSECFPSQARTRITRAGRLHIGTRHETTNKPSLDWVERVRPMAPFAIESVPEILPYKYTKLMYNAAISPVASIAGLDNGQILSISKARQLFFAVLRENYAILRDAHIRLGKIGPFHPRTVSRILNAKLVARALAWAFYPTLRGTYCSMAGDLPKGRTEVEYYNGRLVGLAGERPCPLNRGILALVQRMERERIQPHVRLLDELHNGVR